MAPDLNAPFLAPQHPPPKHPNAESLAAAIPTGPTEEPLQQLWPLARAYLGTCGAGNVTLLLLLAPWRWFLLSWKMWISLRFKKGFKPPILNNFLQGVDEQER